ncbi:hypothetical protein [Streptomyces durhamensis]|nr:hypothetical protein [Streptomyces durhamensis]
MALVIVLVLVEHDVSVALCPDPQVLLECADTVLPALGKLQTLPE